jgi:hypothetical protein
MNLHLFSSEIKNIFIRELEYIVLEKQPYREDNGGNNRQFGNDFD